MIGFMVNKLRGDPRLFDDGIDIIESRSGLPVLGVIPYFTHIALQEEDSVALRRRMERGACRKAEGSERLHIGVVRLPFISNYTDFDCFEQEPGVELIYFDGPRRIFDFDAVILPGSKNTLEDLEHLKRTGLAEGLVAFLKSGGTVVGLCGGYRMLGRSVHDPHGVESGLRRVEGLGLLDMETEMYPDKITSQVEGEVIDGLPFAGFCSARVHGYEIHMGRSTPGERARPLFRITRRDGEEVDFRDGLTDAEGRVWGTYIHGVFDSDAFRRGFLRALQVRSGKPLIPLADGYAYSEWKERQYELLAEHVRRHSDVHRIYEAVGL